MESFNCEIDLSSNPYLSSRYRGSMIGFIVGDALGAVAEGLPSGEISKRFGRITEMLGGSKLGIKAGETTDDTQMMLCIARSLTEKKGFDLKDIADRFMIWHKSAALGEGGQCRRSIQRYITEGSLLALPSIASGNGGVMRVLPLVLAFLNRKEFMLKASIAQSRITHNSQYCDEGCRLYVELVACAINGGCKEDLLAIVGKFPYFYLKDSDGMSGGFIVETLRAVLSCFFSTDSYEEALIKAVNLGGDTDTVAAICGGLAGAFYGYGAIPIRWISALDVPTREEVDELTAKLLKMNMECSKDEPMGLFYEELGCARVLPSSVNVRQQGAMFGFAIGDAMGAYTEGLTRKQITLDYGIVSEYRGGGSINPERRAGETTSLTSIMLLAARSLACLDHFLSDENVVDTEARDQVVRTMTRSIIESVELDIKTSKSGYENFDPGYNELIIQVPLALKLQSIGCYPITSSNGFEEDIQHGNADSNPYVCFFNILYSALEGNPMIYLEQVASRYLLRQPFEDDTSPVDILAVAASCFFGSSSFKETIMNAVNRGGKARMLTAISGALAGAYYGINAIPDEYLQNLNMHSFNDVRTILDICLPNVVEDKQ